MTDQAQSLPAETRLLAEEAYKFGVGPVLLHSVEVVAEVSFDGALWLHVRAQVANGTWDRHGHFVSRELYVDASALRGRGQGNPPATTA
jgi:phage gp46-like protein